MLPDTDNHGRESPCRMAGAFQRMIIAFVSWAGRQSQRNEGTIVGGVRWAVRAARGLPWVWGGGEGQPRGGAHGPPA